jgi:hypothetical protein
MSAILFGFAANGATFCFAPMAETFRSDSLTLGSANLAVPRGVNTTRTSFSSRVEGSFKSEYGFGNFLPQLDIHCRRKFLASDCHNVLHRALFSSFDISSDATPTT